MDRFLRRYGTILMDSGVRIETELHVTCVEAELKPSMSEIDQFAHLRHPLPRYGSGDRFLTIRNPDEIYDEWEEEERQWAEMEALEEMQMKQADPFEDVHEVNSVCGDQDATVEDYENGDYAASEDSTLLNGISRQQERRNSNAFSDVRLIVDGTAALNRARPLSSPVHTPPDAAPHYA
ncbi:ferric-chelate reductase Frp1 [Didymella sp. IMI 355093]|nr:ferric-chelate reductase Frp1 [Didymella sp. IMI 355093]